MKHILVGLAVLGISVIPARAVDVTFSANLTGVCVLAVPTPGILALAPSGTELASDVGGGLPAILTIVSLGTNTITVNAPSYSPAPPSGHVSTGETLQVRYDGTNLLTSVTVPYAATNRSFVVNALPLTALTINARSLNPNGYASGNYGMRVVVTCGP